MRRRSKSVFIGAEVAHYMNAKNFAGESDSEPEEKFVEVNDNVSASYQNYDNSEESDQESELDDDESTDESVLHLIQQVYGQIPSNDKLPFEERLNRIEWSEISSVNNAKQKILKAIEPERKFRFLHEILDDAHKSSLKKLNIKKPVSAIGLFIAENKDALRRVMEKKGSKNMITTANDEYKKLSESAKQTYIERASSTKGSYHSEIKKYTLAFRKGGGGNAKIKEPKLTPFVLFKQHVELKGKTLPRSELMKQYNDLPHNKKIIWILRYLGVNQGSKLTYDQYINAKETLNKDDFQLVEEYEGKPKKIAPYNVFLKEFFKNSNTKDMKIVMKECANSWKNMSATEKAKYQANNSKADWEKRMFEYLSELPEERRNFEIDSNAKLSRKAYEKMVKNFNNPNSTIKAKSPIKSTKASKKEASQILKLKEVSTQSKKSKNKEELFTPVKATPKTKLFAKFEDNETESSPSFLSPSPVFDSPIGKNKEKKKKSLFSKFNDDANESVKINDSVDMPQPIPIKKENDKKRKNDDVPFPKPIKTEISSDTEEKKSKKSKFVDNSFEDSIKHNSTKVEPSPKKKKKSQRDSSSESESVLKPPKSEYKYFLQHIHKGPKSTAKSTFDSLSSRERTKISNLFKKAKANFLQEFEKRIQCMTSEELDKYAQEHNSSMNGDNDEDSD